MIVNDFSPRLSAYEQRDLTSGPSLRPYLGSGCPSDGLRQSVSRNLTAHFSDGTTAIRADLWAARNFEVGNSCLPDGYAGLVGGKVLVDIPKSTIVDGVDGHACIASPMI